MSPLRTPGDGVADARFDRIALELSDHEPPPGARRIIEHCADEAATLMADEGPERIPSFHHSTGWIPWQLLDALRTADVVTGRRFVEWGSGLGVTTMLAARQGFDARGLEIEASLVDRARAYADELDVPCSFVRGDLFAPAPDEADTSATEGPGEWPLLAADLVYVYPWPSEVPRMLDLFAARDPKPGTVLAMYHGGLQFNIWRWSGNA